MGVFLSKLNLKDAFAIALGSAGAAYYGCDFAFA